MSKKTRIFCLLMALVLALSVLSSCKSGGASDPSSTADSGEEVSAGDPESTEDPGEETPGESAADGADNSNAGGTANNSKTTVTPPKGGDEGNTGVVTDRKLVGNVYTSGFPIVEKKTTLRIMVEKTALHGDYNTMKFTTEYEKLTNVKIDWVVYSSAEALTRKVAEINSGNPPDVMGMVQSMSSAEVIQHADSGMLLSLDEGNKLATFAPNVKKALDTNSVAKKSVTAPDGHIYSVPFISSVPDHSNFPSKIYINKSWLTKLNKPTPTTYAELLDVLRAFKAGVPGQSGITPIVMESFNPMFVGAPQGVSWNWLNDRMSVDASGKVFYAPASEAYRDSLRFLRTLYAENLIDKNVFEGKVPIASKISTGKVGVFHSLAGAVALPEKELDNYTILPVMKSTATSKPTVLASQAGTVNPFSWVFTISAAKDQKLETALRWVDYFFTTEGYIYEQFGPPSGGYYKKLSTGKIETNGTKTDAARYKITPGYVIPSWYTLGCRDIWRVKADSELTKGQKYFRDVDEKLSEQYYRPTVQSYYIPNLFFNKADASVIRNNIDAVHSSSFNESMRFVKGERNIDSDWSAYVTQLKTLKMDEVVAVYQKYYNAAK